MIERSPYVWKSTEEAQPCPIGCCSIRAYFDEMGEHVRVKHPEPPIPAEIIVLSDHTRKESHEH